MAARPDRVTDPDNHHPYKHADVLALVEENPPFGPEGDDDDRVRVEDYMSAAIADASRVYIDAQEAYLTHPGDGTRADYDAAKAALEAARAEHRANRVGMTVVGIRARRAGE